MRPRDSRGRYTKISSKNSPIFGDKTPSLSRNPRERYMSNQREEDITQEILGKQVEETIKSNSVGTKNESPQKELLAVPETSESGKI